MSRILTETISEARRQIAESRSLIVSHGINAARELHPIQLAKTTITRHPVIATSVAATTGVILVKSLFGRSKAPAPQPPRPSLTSSLLKSAFSMLVVPIAKKNLEAFLSRKVASFRSTSGLKH